MYIAPDHSSLPADQDPGAYTEGENFGKELPGGIWPSRKVAKWSPRRNFRGARPTTSLRIQMQYCEFRHVQRCTRRREGAKDVFVCTIQWLCGWSALQTRGTVQSPPEKNSALQDSWRWRNVPLPKSIPVDIVPLQPPVCAPFMWGLAVCWRGCAVHCDCERHLLVPLPLDLRMMNAPSQRNAVLYPMTPIFVFVRQQRCASWRTAQCDQRPRHPSAFPIGPMQHTARCPPPPPFPKIMPPLATEGQGMRRREWQGEWGRRMTGPLRQGGIREGLHNKSAGPVLRSRWTGDGMHSAWRHPRNRNPPTPMS